MAEIAKTTDITSEYKKPAMILSAANTAGILAGFAYFYKELQLMKEQIKKVEESQKALSTNLVTLNTQMQQKSDMIKTLNEDLKVVSESISSVDKLTDDFTQLLQVLENDYDVQLEEPEPIKKPKKSYKQQTKSHSQKNDSFVNQQEDDLDELITIANDNKRQVVRRR